MHFFTLNFIVLYCTIYNRGLFSRPVTLNFHFFRPKIGTPIRPTPALRWESLHWLFFRRFFIVFKAVRYDERTDRQARRIMRLIYAWYGRVTMPLGLLLHIASCLYREVLYGNGHAFSYTAGQLLTCALMDIADGKYTQR